MASFGETGERETIRNIMKIIRPSGREGPGDDAALADISGRLAISTDATTVERHMPETMTFEQFGWYSAAVSFSDISAMGARPKGILASLMFPPSLGEEKIYDIMSGIDQCAEFCGTAVIGGDTKNGNGAIVTTAIGDTEDRKPMMRSGAKPGDLVAVTGPLGAPAAGWHSIKNGFGLEDAEDALMVPIPRWEEGIALSSSGAVTSCMDLSDGLAEAAWGICSASRVGMEVCREFLPEGPGVDDIHSELMVSKDEMMLYWGGEYELMFTFGKDEVEKLYEGKVDFSIIGTVTNGREPIVFGEDGREVMKHGVY
jgi:thiamine-monophosphate kinase